MRNRTPLESIKKLKERDARNFTVYLTLDQVKKLRARAADTNKTFSAIVRQILDESFERDETATSV